MRKGSKSSHTKGYRMSASRAIGQHRINKIIHKKKAAMATSIVAAAVQSPGTETPRAGLV